MLKPEPPSDLRPRLIATVPLQPDDPTQRRFTFVLRLRSFSVEELIATLARLACTTVSQSPETLSTLSVSAVSLPPSQLTVSGAPSRESIVSLPAPPASLLK